MNEEDFLLLLEQFKAQPDALRTAATGSLGRMIPPGEQGVAELPGVGQGLLDTLRTMYGKRLAFDTSSSDPGRLGSFQRRLPELGIPSKVTVNPSINELDPPAAMTLGHEVLGHGIEGIATSPLAVLSEAVGLSDHQQEADKLGQGLMAATGRADERTADPETFNRVMELLAKMQEKKN